MLAYVNAKSKILKYIRDSGLEAGDRLPTEVELSERLGIGRLSLREGLNALKSEGIVVAMQGRGTFVACSSTQISDTLNLNYSVTEMIRCSGHEPGIAYFKKEIVPADKVVAAALKIELDMDVSLCTRIRTADDMPVVMTEDYLAPALASAFLAMGPQDISLYEYIEKNSDFTIGSSITQISPECADERLSDVLKIPVGTPVLVFCATVNDVYGAPLIYAREHFRADRFQFVVMRSKK